MKIEWGRMGESEQETGFEQRREELAEMAAELEELDENDFFPERDDK